jgi:hypothetical protein
VSKFLIYALVDPRTDAVRYIGKSCSGMKRPLRHFQPKLLAADNTYKARWIRALMAEIGGPPSVRVLEVFASAVDLNDAECFWIAQGHGLGWSLTNLTKGGDGISGMKRGESFRQQLAKRYLGKKLSAEHRAKLSESHKGVKISESHRSKMADGIRAWWKDPANRIKHSIPHRAATSTSEFRAKISAVTRGRKTSPEVRAKIAASHRGMKHSDETKAKMKAAWVLRKARSS